MNKLSFINFAGANFIICNCLFGQIFHKFPIIRTTCKIYPIDRLDTKTQRWEYLAPEVKGLWFRVLLVFSCRSTVQ